MHVCGFRALGTTAFALTAILAAEMPAAGASYPPDLRFRTLTTPTVSVHFQEELEPAAREAAALSEEILATLCRRYQVRVGRVHVVLADASDSPNGSAAAFPYTVVHVTMAAPDGADELGVHAGWLRFVLTHELAHVVHLEQARGLAHVGRQVFGRAPFLFPNAATPSWMVEGLATFEETQGTAFGRGRDRDARMLLRMAALEGRFPREDQATVGLDQWPGGHVPYLFGEAFLRDLTARFGAETLPRLARKHAAWPFPFLDEITSLTVTRGTFTRRWREFARSTQATFASEADGLRQRGLSASTALTRRGVRQSGARVSADGRWIAYTSATLARQHEVRVMAADGSGDRPLARRNGGTQLCWTPAGDAVVYDEPDYERLFRWRSDLRVVDVATGRVRRLTRGLRASDPDVTPDGQTVVFVRRHAGGSELAMVAMSGDFLGDLTQSAPGTLWSGPRVSPRGDAVVAARLTPDGHLDLVLVDLSTLELRRLTNDRAKDLEPSWSPDGVHVLFRSDRDGVSNIYALRLDDGALLRVTRVLGGAFAPALDPSGTRLIYSEYSAAGYDLHALDVALSELSPADDFVDPYPSLPAAVSASAAPAEPYRSLPHLWPRFWTPYAFSSSATTRLGALSAGADPLGRNSWLLLVHRTRETRRLGFEAAYVYDRYRTSFLLNAQELSEPQEEGTLRTQRLRLGAGLPLARSVRFAHTLEFAWRGERQDLMGKAEAAGRRQRLSGLELSWSFGSAKQYPFNISPVDGSRARLALLYQASWLGSDAHVLKPSIDVRKYLRLSETHALALRAGAATTLGQRATRDAYSMGGFPSGSFWDLSAARPGVLRGYSDGAFVGRHVLYVNAEYRFPLLRAQRGLWSLPAFVRHVHGTVFADAGQAWTGAFALGEVKTAVGVAVGTDAFLGHWLPLTGTAGIARGLGSKGQTRAYVRLGLAF